MNRVQFVVSPDRTNLGRIDLTISTGLATITNHKGSRQLFSQVHSIDGVHVLHHVEILDVDNIVSIKLALDVDRLRIGGSRQQIQIAAEALLRSLGITLRTKRADVSHVSLTSANSADGTLVYFGKHLVHPALISRNQFGRTRTNILIFGEQRRNAVKALIRMLQILVVFVGVHFQRSLPATHAGALGSRQDSLLIGVTQSLLTSIGFLVKHIVLHIGFILLILIFLIARIDRFVHQSINDCLLLIRQAVEDVSNGLILTIFLILFLGFLVGMFELDKFSGVNESLFTIFFHRAVAVHDH